MKLPPILLALSTLIIATTAQGDPFHSAPQQATTHVEQGEEFTSHTLPQENPKESEDLAKTSPCDLPHLTQAEQYPFDFNQLKLVGLIRINEHYQGLFLNENQQLIALKKGDFLTLSQTEISDINLKSIHYIDWLNTPQCDQPRPLQRKL
ncbi:hypothetical protein A4G19_02695 [Pasteurellaceae bacterium Macca]|nr:hypothetical protein [Pasteurellaceae bacterium Macca]